ncbi:conserved hypothetical protein [Talaromyces stipitatus ATCC 10500]|uniref:Arylsulfotransferase n=1 Tax=Talaromyces stipitatus (strain ATCC 10500 / CBS 375.48 / QM 6759 / NRRL 1006) TaxID=441959 RepID=B8MEL9_TALSN|nr:uncharacterized protein TSTA_019640 [Talaromyces stipitatus ATCC 10500]EED16902.1 conserved hypothetical protein [Talaromyces stipitatus ATCC 10500]
MSPSRPQKRPKTLRKWTVRLSALFTIIATLLLLLVEQPYSSIRDLKQHHLPSVPDYSLIRSPVSLFSAESADICTPGYIFSIPDGRSPTIVDQNGELIWRERRNSLTQNLRVQMFRGQDYLTYWIKEPYSHGSYHMLDSSYTTRYIVTPVGRMIDSLHDFTITRRDTALIAANYKRRADLSVIGGPRDGWILDAVFQEIDIVTGNLLYEWRAADHVFIANTLQALEDGEGTEDHPFDYFHITGVDQGPSGAYLVSAGNMRAVMSVDATSGQVQWNLGGHANDFRAGGRPVVDFVWPHNARWGENATVAVMDKADSGTNDRGMVIQINPHTAQAVVQQTFNSPKEPKGFSAGDIQVSEGTGNVLISWAGGRGFSEYTADGELLCQKHISDKLSGFRLLRSAASSRVSKHTWTGKPLTKPIIKTSVRRLHVQWNGATEVAEWQLQARKQLLPSKHNDLQDHEIGRFKKTGFETSFTVPPLKGSSGYFLRIAALDQQGQIIGYSDDVEWQEAWTGSDLSQSQFRFLAGVCLFGGLLTLLSTLHIHIRLRNRERRILLPLHKL